MPRPSFLGSIASCSTARNVHRCPYSGPLRHHRSSEAAFATCCEAHSMAISQPASQPASGTDGRKPNILLSLITRYLSARPTRSGRPISLCQCGCCLGWVSPQRLVPTIQPCSGFLFQHRADASQAYTIRTMYLIDQHSTISQLFADLPCKMQTSTVCLRRTNSYWSHSIQPLLLLNGAKSAGTMDICCARAQLELLLSWHLRLQPRGACQCAADAGCSSQVYT